MITEIWTISESMRPCTSAQYFLGLVILTHQKKFNFLSKNNKSSNTHLSQRLKFCPYWCSVYTDSSTYGTNVLTFEYTKIKLLICHYGIRALSFVCFVLKSCDVFKLIYVHSFLVSLTSDGMHLGNSWQSFKVQICG